MSLLTHAKHTALQPILLLAITLFGVLSSRAQAQSIPFDASKFSNVDQLLTDERVRAVVKVVGVATAYRAYEPATPLGRGLTLGVEATLNQTAADFKEALQAAGTSSTNIPVLPMARIHLHKGISEAADLGIAFIFYQNYRVYGGDLKVAVLDPEQGPTVALRAGVSFATLGFVSTMTLSPQIVISRQMSFADPYVVSGLDYCTGTVNLTQTIPAAPPDIPEAITITFPEKSAKAYAGFIGGGVSFRVPNVALHLVLEGTYNTGGINTLGAKVGLAF